MGRELWENRGGGGVIERAHNFRSVFNHDREGETKSFVQTILCHTLLFASYRTPYTPSDSHNSRFFHPLLFLGLLDFGVSFVCLTASH